MLPWWIALTPRWAGSSRDSGAQRTRQHAHPFSSRQRRKRRRGPERDNEGLGRNRKPTELCAARHELGNAEQHAVRVSATSTSRTREDELAAHRPLANGISASRNGALEKQPCHLVDIMATCVDLAGAKYPTEFNGNRIEPLQVYACVPVLTANRLRAPSRSFGSTKAIKPSATENGNLCSATKTAWQLFDMDTDRTEQHDLSKQHPRLH